MTALRDILAAQIAAQGPLTIAQYMTACLLHPEHGYYTTRDPFGTAGDFTTAPEISQMYGELIGLALAQTWLDQGAPAVFTLAELGPGRGTLMADILRATARVPGFHAGARLHLVEASPTLRARQAESLRGASPIWHDSVDDLPNDAPIFAVASEFFDALPVRQFLRDGGLWRERVVGLRGGELAFGMTDALPDPRLTVRLDDTRDGDLIETCAPAKPIAAALGSRIATHGGLALIADYGGWRSLGDTFQAVRRHQSTDPLQDPGQADLTAHVDFEALAEAAPCAHTPLTPQGVFLERLGITERARALAARLDGDALDSHVNAHRRLTHPDEMGTVFKMLGFFPHGAPLPPGFAHGA
ncbi:class I SAM-dependent methyltransferase [Puniceibacterium sediminis]|uniref:SAM-dependent methyltransferase, MidA family n=1 Tax=Puniceibacterium sediminis TaxID=1608407 RepID=A0A238WP88_9RHOB|nr:SAM-dependent methyltransferase [Puniceibacterium sediminis]SNR47499.1 SAM-dependent methyltransferase, MidA family [Puniceibacterium sediminis]